jgi:hypothetical protein
MNTLLRLIVEWHERFCALPARAQCKRASRARKIGRDSSTSTLLKRNAQDIDFLVVFHFHNSL